MVRTKKPHRGMRSRRWSKYMVVRPNGTPDPRDRGASRLLAHAQVCPVPVAVVVADVELLRVISPPDNGSGLAAPPAVNATAHIQREQPPLETRRDRFLLSRRALVCRPRYGSVHRL